MGVPDYIYISAAVLAGLAAAIGGLVVTINPTAHDLRVARGLFCVAGLAAATIAITFGATSPSEAIVRNILVAISGATIGAYFYVMLAWLNGKIRLTKNPE